MPAEEKRPKCRDGGWGWVTRTGQIATGENSSQDAKMTAAVRILLLLLRVAWVM